MAIVEFHGGPITHHYLTKRSKSDLIHLYFEYRRITNYGLLSKDDLWSMLKWQIAGQRWPYGSEGRT